jgi:hypothetical protein
MQDKYRLKNKDFNLIIHFRRKQEDGKRNIELVPGSCD